jgi:hypothetical protein
VNAADVTGRGWWSAVALHGPALRLASGIGSIVPWVVAAAHGLQAGREFDYRLRLRQIAAT